MRRGLLGALFFLMVAGSAAAESPFIYGIHDSEGAHILTDDGGPGGYTIDPIIVDPNRTLDYSALEARGVTVIVRLNHHFGQGTIPATGPGEEYADYDAWARAIAAMVSKARGVQHWIIANETNLPREWPRRRSDGRLVPLTVDRVADCYARVYRAIKAARPEAIVMPPPVGVYAPSFNADGQVDFGPSQVVPHFVDYNRQLMARVASMTDAIALHAYTHGADPALVKSEQTMQPPLAGVFYHFRVYRNVLAGLPASLRLKPVYITECNQNVEDRPGDRFQNLEYTWRDENRGWIQAVYQEVKDWNDSHAQKIRTVCLFRYGSYPEGPFTYGIDRRPRVLEDFRQARDRRFTWTEGSAAPPPPSPPPAGEPDVVIEDLRLSPARPRPGELIRIIARVRNRGAAPTPAGVTIGVGYHIDGRFVSWGAVTGPLAPGASIELINNGPEARAGPAGAFTLRAQVDDVNRFDEADEDNNRAELAFEVAAPQALPDVIVESIGTRPARPRAGEEVAFFCVVRNRGAAPTPAGVTLGVAYTIDGRYVSWGAIPGPLAPGGRVELQSQGGRWTADRSGRRVLGAQVDDINRFAESDENNNRREQELVLAAPSGPRSITGPGPARFGSGRQSDAVTPINRWRLAAEYFGLRGIDAIVQVRDSRGGLRDLVLGLQQSDLVELRMEAGPSDLLEVRAVADGRGPADLQILVDGRAAGTLRFDQSDYRLRVASLRLPGDLGPGPHFIAVEQAGGRGRLILEALRVRR